MSEKKKYNPVEKAYLLLEAVLNKCQVEIDISEVMCAVEEAVGYLGEALE